MSQQNSPYSRPSPMRCICVANRRVNRGTSFVQEGGLVKITAFKTTTTSALSTGNKVYLAPKSGEEAGFEEEVTYVIKNYTLSLKFGHECIFVGPSSTIFKTAPIPLAEEARARAKEALCPPSCWTSGEDSDLFTKGGYVTLSGHVERLQVVRMTQVKEGEVPILDFHLTTGGKVIEVSLWRDEALVGMKMGDHIQVTHLKANVWPNGRSKMNSTSYTTIKVTESAMKTVEVEIIGLSEEADVFILLDSDYGEYRLPSDLYMGASEDLLGELPMTVILDHLNFKVVKFTKK